VYRPIDAGTLEKKFILTNKDSDESMMLHQ